MVCGVFHIQFPDYGTQLVVESCRAVAHAAATAVLAAALFPVQNFSIARLSRGSRPRGNGGSFAEPARVAAPD